METVTTNMHICEIYCKDKETRLPIFLVIELYATYATLIILSRIGDFSICASSDSIFIYLSHRFAGILHLILLQKMIITSV